MRSELLCDNDVILKSCCFDLSIEVALCLDRIGTCFILGSASFVIVDRIKRSKSICSKERAAQNFELFREQAKVVDTCACVASCEIRRIPMTMQTIVRSPALALAIRVLHRLR
jgi:hypothetical protein